MVVSVPEFSIHHATAGIRVFASENVNAKRVVGSYYGLLAYVAVGGKLLSRTQ